MKKLAVICARSGSKGIKNKNLLKINNKSLIEITIEHAKKAKLFDEIVFSSDSNNYLKIASKLGIKLLHKRSSALSSNVSAKIPSIRESLKYAEKKRATTFDFICDLDVTSPYRMINDILKSFKKFKLSKNFQNQISVIESHKNPYFNMFKSKNNRLFKFFPSQTFIRRQDVPKVFSANASIYWWKRKYLLSSDKIIFSNTGYYIMNEFSIDIDTKKDYEFVKFVMELNAK